MSNIHTLADYRESGGPNRAAIPNPWATASSTTSSYDDGWSRSPSLPSSYPDTSSRYFIRLQGLEGEERMVSMEEFKERPFATTGQLCCMHCCPCFFMSNRTKALKTLLSFCALISIVQVVMLVEALAMGGFAPLHENPMIGPPTDTLVKLGAKDVDLIKEDYQVWRFITPVFLHAGIIHLFFNLLFQLRFGLLMEREWGVLRFFALYTVSAVGGNLMSCLLRPGSISVGASTGCISFSSSFFASFFVLRSSLFFLFFLFLFLFFFSFFSSSFSPTSSSILFSSAFFVFFFLLSLLSLMLSFLLSSS
ncbi:Rho1-Guanine Exchange Factor-like protein, variant 2 [Balamuthia mandrillaris]